LFNKRRIRIATANNKTLKENYKKIGKLFINNTISYYLQFFKQSALGRKRVIVVLRFGPTMLDASERALDSGWNQSAAISGRARVKVGHS